MKKNICALLLLCCAILFCAFNFEPAVKIKEDNGIYIIKINKTAVLEPFVVSDVLTNKEVHDKNNFLLTINGGYFDTVNQKTTSFVTINEKVILNPEENENLVNNPKLINNLKQIYNRSELRYINCKDGYKYTINKHFEPIEKDCKLIHALQAGPQLLPDITSEEEFFITKNKNEITRNPISVNKKVPRIAVGLDKENILYIFIATKQNPMTLKELSKYMLEKNIVKALNLDGGGSVSLNYKNIDVFSDFKNTRRKLKSFLVVKKH